MVRCGDIFYHGARDKFYMIARIDIRRVHMVDLESGENFNNHVFVENVYDITYDEFDKLIGHARISQFEYSSHISNMFKRDVYG